MWNIKEKGSGLIGLILTIAIIVALVFGWKQLTGKDDKNQIERRQDAIDAAEEAARLQREHDAGIQSELQGSADVNYRSVQDRAKNLQQ